MSEFVVEIKEVYIVKYRCTASSKEEIEKIFTEDYFHFGSRCKLEPIQDSMEYFGDTGSGDALHSVRTIEEYNKDNEESSKIESVLDSSSLNFFTSSPSSSSFESTPDYTESVSGYKESVSGYKEPQEEGDEFVIE